VSTLKILQHVSMSFFEMTYVLMTSISCASVAENVALEFLLQSLGKRVLLQPLALQIVIQKATRQKYARRITNFPHAYCQDFESAVHYHGVILGRHQQHWQQHGSWWPSHDYESHEGVQTERPSLLGAFRLQPLSAPKGFWLRYKHQRSSTYNA
jgi:hypothetical protein